MVGDGRSDFCVAGQVDHVLAKGELIDECRRQGLPVPRFTISVMRFRRCHAGLMILPAQADTVPLTR